MPLPVDLIRFLASVHPYDTLTEAALSALADKASVVDEAAGTQLFTIGDDVEFLFLLVAGEVEILDESAAPLSLLGPRNSFGERAILRSEKASRTATVLADATMIRIPAPVLVGLIGGVIYGLYLLPVIQATLAETVSKNPLSFIVPKTFIRDFPGLVLFVSEKTEGELRDLWVWQLDDEQRVLTFGRAETGRINELPSATIPSPGDRDAAVDRMWSWFQQWAAISRSLVPSKTLRITMGVSQAAARGSDKK